MRPRELGGAVTRAEAIFMWVPFGVFEEGDEDEEEGEGVEGEIIEDELPPDEVIVGEPDAETVPTLDDLEGCWVAVTKVQARELIAEACTNEAEEIEAEERPTGLYIGLGPLP